MGRGGGGVKPSWKGEKTLKMDREAQRNTQSPCGALTALWRFTLKIVYTQYKIYRSKIYLQI